MRQTTLRWLADRIRRHGTGARLLSAGMVDAGFASLATFSIGVYAARELSASALGIYAFFFAAFIMTAVIPEQLVFRPLEIQALGFERSRRLWLLKSSVRMALGPCVAAAMALGAATLLAPRSAGSTLWGMMASAAVLTVLSPIQDHIRRTLHLSGVSWRAASVSMCQFAATVGAIGLLTILGVGLEWIPFGSLALANAVSLSFGIALARVGRGPDIGMRPRYSEVLAIGRYLLVAGIIAPAGGFAVAAIVGRLAGSDTLGFAEAARVVAQPIFVLSMGLSAALSPRSMEAASESDVNKAIGIRRAFNYVVVLSGLAYLAVASSSGQWNPLARLVPKAYEVTGLVTVSILAYGLTGLTFLKKAELLGGRKEKPLAVIELIGNALRALVAVTSRIYGAFAVPGGFLVLAIWRLAGYSRATRSIFRRDPDPTEGS
jgi:O-antigen/teichoic acid export membrane protein